MNTNTRIIIVRHASKLPIEEPGFALDARGEILAMKFGLYYRQTFGDPDVVIAAKASSNPNKPQSIRSQQTVGPLLSLLAEDDVIPIFQHDKLPENYEDVAKRILTEYAGKSILVCWEHKRINKLAKALGVKETLPKWQKDDFNSVYDISLTSKGTQIQILRNQYSTTFHGSFKDIVNALESPRLKANLPSVTAQTEDSPVILNQFHLTLQIRERKERHVPYQQEAGVSMCKMN